MIFLIFHLKDKQKADSRSQVSGASAESQSEPSADLSTIVTERQLLTHTHTLSNKDNKRKKKKNSTYKLTDSGEYLHSLWRKSYCSDNFSSSHFSFLSATYAVISFLNTLVIRLFSFLQSKENLDTVSSPRFICKCNNCL